MITNVTQRTLGPEVKDLIQDLLHRFEQQRRDLSPLRAKRRAQLSSGDVDLLPETVHMRQKKWQVDPVPEGLLERRVELIGGATRSELITGLNAGAKSYIADLWNFTSGDAWSIRRAHRSLERAAKLDLAFLDPYEGRVRVNPNTTTRLMVVPRPLHALESSVMLDDEAVPAAFYDLATLAVKCGPALIERQGGLYLVLRDTHGHMEARLWARLFDAVEEKLEFPRGSIRATVMLDSVAAALEAEEILFELVHHAAGLSISPQTYAADHIALFHGKDEPVFPDREVIGLNAPFLRALGLRTIGIAHRRGCHAIGAPSYVLPPPDPFKMKASYLEMLADKEREAVDGYDGTIVVHMDTVNPAMVEFNKSMPRANQLYYQRNDAIEPADLIKRPEGTITTESLVGSIRTCLLALVQRNKGEAWVVQGGRLHDRSSLRLALRILWQWNHARAGVVTANGLDIHPDLIGFLTRKEVDKLFAQEDERTKAQAAKAMAVMLDLVFGEAVPLEPQF